MITLEELQLAARLPLLTLGARANTIREMSHGNRVYFAPRPGEALELCVPSNASPEEIALALLIVREQNPSSVEPRIVAIHGDTTGEAEIRLVALSRLALPATTHIRANWTTLSDAMAQVALRFGADELCGFPPELDRREIYRAIREAGRDPYPCDAQYLPLDLPEPPAKLRVLAV